MNRLAVLAIAGMASIIIVAGRAIPAGAAAVPATASYETISGSGSSAESVAIEQWAEDVEPEGLTVNFNPDGSAAGRGDYMQGSLVDFALSDVPFRDGSDKLAGTSRETVSWGYSYIPAVAEGIAFVYNAPVHGKQVTGLRLSPSTLLGIFTGKITNWDSPQITGDNGHRLPSLRIKPVVDLAEFGPTYYFTQWLAKMFPRQWNAFCAQVTKGRVKAPCGPTAFYPVSGPGWHPQAEDGASQVADYVGSSHSAGSISFVQDAYALTGGLPTAELRNPDGRYVMPGSANVAWGLTAATVNENPRSRLYLQENLDAVYTLKKPLSYPLSYYAYWIVPRSGTQLPPIFNRAAGGSLSAFISFALCTGQDEAAELGYALLPPNLVQAGLRQVATIPGHVAVPSLAQCDRLPAPF